MRYRPAFTTQEDGSECQWRNCWAACGSMAVDAASGGKRTPTPTQVRRLARKADCLPGGIADIVRVLMALGLWHRAKYRADIPVAELRRMLLRRSGAVVMLETDFGSWPDEAKCNQTDALHSVIVICGNGTGDKRGKVMTGDPLCARWRWTDVDGVLNAARAYNAGHHETPGTIDALIVLPPMED